jgi:hypothetical protein
VSITPVWPKGPASYGTLTGRADLLLPMLGRFLD